MKKLYKLWTHQKNFSEEDIVINPKYFPDIQIGDVVEINCPDVADYSPLLVQVKSLSETILQHKDVVSISTNLAQIFHLRMYTEVYVSVVNSREVALDLVELTYREQYFSRADMWRLKKNLTNNCLYLSQKVTFAEMRVQVHELWSKGVKVTCGYVTEDTRVTFRSSTAQVNIFIQMSCEMWEFDNYGDLYFEKALDGFLVDLFGKWKEKGCNHDVTITLFSRTCYNASSIEEFPMHMRECVQKHHKGYFYEDYYRVVVQNEKYDDWTRTMIEMRKLFHEYHSRVVQYHQTNSPSGTKVPQSWNTNATEGNFLEVLNMSLNVYEKYFLDRCFDRTGKLSIVITPGPGVFEVDRQLASITKHRTIDCGNSSDLVCMGEQPLHVVPLFMFFKKQTSRYADDGVDYNIPHWINHSFYTSKSQAQRMSRGEFIPRIQMNKSVQMNGRKMDDEDGDKTVSGLSESVSPFLSDEVPFVDYDKYDAQVFKLPTQKALSVTSDGDSQAVKRMRIPRRPYTDAIVDMFDDEPNIPAVTRETFPGSLETDYFMPHSFTGHTSKKQVEPSQVRSVVGSCVGPVKHQRLSYYNYYQPKTALFNPFTPSRLRFKVTSNRRRWAHAFPTDLQGASVQLHHKHSDGFKREESHVDHFSQSKEVGVDGKRMRSRKFSDSSDIQEHRLKAVTISSGESGSADSLKDFPVRVERESSRELKKVSSSGTLTSLTPIDSSLSSWGVGSHGIDKDGFGGRHRLGQSSSYHRDLSTVSTNEDENWVWGITGEQEWTPEIKTGVDWKSMTIPASLPISTDYFPDKQSLENDYVFHDYQLLPDDFNLNVDQICPRPDIRKPLTTVQVYKEMVAQRLAQGFQIVMLPKNISTASLVSLSSSPYQSSSLMRRSKIEPTEDIILSIGRIFHHLLLNGPKINVTTYWPRHPFEHMNYHYTYRFQVPDSENYDVSWTDFVYTRLENYNWNYVDGYLCTKGEDDFSLIDSLRYWRSHLLLLPCNNPATRTIIEGSPRCDVYEERDMSDQGQLVQNFLRLVEMLNKIRRHTQVACKPNKKEIQGRKLSLTSSPIINLGDSSSKVKVISKPEGMETPPIGSYSATSINSMFAESLLKKTPGGSVIEFNPGSLTPLRTDPTDQPVKNFNLTLKSPVLEIRDAMLDASSGLYFVKQHTLSGLSTLPNYSFIADEAIAWVRVHVEGVDSNPAAVEFFQNLISQNIICHASGNRKHKFVPGFYMYSILEDKKDSEFGSAYYYDSSFEHEWLEVVTHYPEDSDVLTRLNHCDFLDKPLPDKELYTLPTIVEGVNKSGHVHFTGSALYKTVTADVDPSRKSDRQEWGKAHYHANYSPNAAFELTVQWLVATGCILGDLIQMWARKAGAFGFHLLPVPGDPFALPFTPSSDPLRGPIFVPLNIDCLKPHGEHLFEDYNPDTRDERLVIFQDSILRRFGFMSDKCPMQYTQPVSYPDEKRPKYVHCTGGMFTMIPDTKTTSPRNKDGTHCKLNVGSFKNYIALQSGGGSHSMPGECCGEHSEPQSFYQVGFLWSWNYMLAKRWRTPNTGDEHFQDKMLADFRAFCSNKDNRLLEYWQDCVSRHRVFHTHSNGESDAVINAEDNGVVFSIGQEDISATL